MMVDYDIYDVLRFIGRTGKAAQLNMERYFSDHEKLHSLLKQLEDMGAIIIYHIERPGYVDFSEDEYIITDEGKAVLEALAKDNG